MSMDSMNVMYDSEYDDLRLASASAGNIVNLKKKRKNFKKINNLKKNEKLSKKKN